MSSPAIVVVAFNRPASLRRLLGSLLAAEYPCSVELIISIDGGGDSEVFKIADEFRWPEGNKEIIRRGSRMGLREHVLACGDLTDHYESIIVLEDDLYVSPVFYHFAQQASKFYKNRPEIGGIGLYAYRRNLSNGLLFEPLADETDIIFLQYACSWGQVWAADQWKPFRQWYSDERVRESTNPEYPGYVHNWPDTSWLKYHIKYLVDTDRFFVSPRVSLTTCYQDVGQHSESTSSLHQVALQFSKKEFRLKHIGESFCVYDAWHTIVPDRLNTLVPGLSEYDYVIDFYGQKPLDDFSESFVLGCMRSRFPIMEFGLEMRPIEMNVISGLPGKGITLARTADVDLDVGPAHHAIRIYPEIGVRKLSQMLRCRLLEKTRGRIRELKGN